MRLMPHVSSESALRAHCFAMHTSHTPPFAAGYASKMEIVLLCFLALRRLLRDAQVAFPAAGCRELQSSVVGVNDMCGKPGGGNTPTDRLHFGRGPC